MVEQPLKKEKNNEETSASLSDVFPLKPPHVYAAISRDPVTKGPRYLVIDPTSSESEEAAAAKIKEILYETIDANMKDLGSKDDVTEFLENSIRQIVKLYKIKLDSDAMGKVQYYLVRDLVGFGKIDPLMYDNMVEDISCDGPNIPVYIWHRQHESIPTNIEFAEDELDAFVVRLAYLAGKHISIANPMLDASLADGSRIQITYGKEVTRKGSTFTIRRFRAIPLTVADLISLGTMSPEMAAWLWMIIERKYNMIIGGGTASGKTTTLNALCTFVPPDNKIITIEDTAELNLPHKNCISSVARTGFGPAGSSAEISLYDLLKAAMRQRPDYIIVGEVRGSEAYTLFQAMATGHGGLSSIHSDSTAAALQRLESEPMNISRTLLATVNVVALQTMVHKDDRNVRRMSHVVEIVGMDPVSREILTNEVFRWDPKDDSFAHSGRSLTLEKLAERHGLTEQAVKDEWDNRKLVLEWMASSRLNFDKVNFAIREYYANPATIVEKAKLGLSA